MNTEIILVEIFLSKSKLLLPGRSNCVECAICDSNDTKAQKYYIADIKINLQPKCKESFRNKPENIANKNMPYITRKNL